MKATEQLNAKIKELAKRISFLVDEFEKENGFCELEINTQYYYT